MLYGCEQSGPVSKRLNSGKVIYVLYSKEDSFGKKEKTLTFGYQTEIQIDDLQSLKIEAEEIWDTIRAEAESQAYQRVIILPHERDPDNIADRSGQFRFVYSKSGGQWQME